MMLDLAAIELQYDLLTERSTDQEYADMLQNIPDLIARVRELTACPVCHEPADELLDHLVAAHAGLLDARLRARHGAAAGEFQL